MLARRRATTANVQYDPSTSLAERHSLYEAEVAEALLDETDEERAERLELVRAAEAMVLAAFHKMCEGEASTELPEE